jgi:hypothetical protein
VINRQKIIDGGRWIETNFRPGICDCALEFPRTASSESSNITQPASLSSSDFDIFFVGSASDMIRAPTFGMKGSGREMFRRNRD